MNGLISYEDLQNYSKWNSSFNDANYTFPYYESNSDACAMERSVQHVIGAILTILGLIGNGAFLYVVLKLPYMKTVTNLYLCSLAVADFLYLSVNSVTIFCHFDNDLACRHLLANVAFACSTEFLISTSFLASIMIIALIGIERYIAISRPLSKGSRASQHGSRWLLLVVTSTWLPAFILSSPALIQCFYPLAEIFEARVVITMISFFVMIVLVLVFYLLIACKLLKASHSVIATRRSAGENERQVIRVCLLTAIVFVICLCPYMVRLVFDLLIVNRIIPVTNYVYYCFYNLAIFLLIINATINPVVYNAASRRYRRAFKDAFLCRRRQPSRYKSYIYRSQSSENAIDTGTTLVYVRGRVTSVRKQRIPLEKL
ncbi:somatostatin receptor type 5-like [Glandiceps talaboti]